MQKGFARYGSKANLPTSGLEPGELLFTTDRGTAHAATGPATVIPLTPAVDDLAELLGAGVSLASDMLMLHDADASGKKEKRILLSQLLLAVFASPALTGNPTAPTQAAGNNSTRLATTAFVQAAVAALVNSSPAALDTLNELAAALGNDPNFATTITNALAGKQPLDATLTALAGLTVAANQLVYSTGADAFAVTALSAFARTLLDDADAATARATLGAATAALDSGVISVFENSWVNYGGSFAPAGYFKDGFGLVHLTGLVKSGTAGTTMFTLPSGYRPGNVLYFPASSTTQAGVIRVWTDGKVDHVVGPTGNFSLDGVCFRAA